MISVQNCPEEIRQKLWFLEKPLYFTVFISFLTFVFGGLLKVWPESVRSMAASTRINLEDKKVDTDNCLNYLNF
jgi:hypothetical protein